MAISIDGSGHVWACGDNGWDQLGEPSCSRQTYQGCSIDHPIEVTGLSRAVSGAVGTGHMLALTANHGL